MPKRKGKYPPRKETIITGVRLDNRGIYHIRFASGRENSRHHLTKSAAKFLEEQPFRYIKNTGEQQIATYPFPEA